MGVRYWSARALQSTLFSACKLCTKVTKHSRKHPTNLLPLTSTQQYHICSSNLQQGTGKLIAKNPLDYWLWIQLFLLQSPTWNLDSVKTSTKIFVMQTRWTVNMTGLMRMLWLCEARIIYLIHLQFQHSSMLFWFPSYLAFRQLENISICSSILPKYTKNWNYPCYRDRKTSLSQTVLHSDPTDCSLSRLWTSSGLYNHCLDSSVAA